MVSEPTITEGDGNATLVDFSDNPVTSVSGVREISVSETGNEGCDVMAVDVLVSMAIDVLVIVLGECACVMI